MSSQQPLATRSYKPRPGHTPERSSRWPRPRRPGNARGAGAERCLPRRRSPAWLSRRRRGSLAVPEMLSAGANMAAALRAAGALLREPRKWGCVCDRERLERPGGRGFESQGPAVCVWGEGGPRAVARLSDYGCRCHHHRWHLSALQFTLCWWRTRCPLLLRPGQCHGFWVEGPTVGRPGLEFSWDI